MYNPEQFFQDIKKQPPGMFKYGTVDPAYTSGNPKVQLDGETAISSATFRYLDSYTPTAGDRVLLVNANGYVILGKVV